MIRTSTEPIYLYWLLWEDNSLWLAIASLKQNLQAQGSKFTLVRSHLQVSCTSCTMAKQGTIRKFLTIKDKYNWMKDE